MAEHLLRAAVTARHLPWTISSAGTRAQPGTLPHPSAIQVLAERGIPVAPTWRTRQFDPTAAERPDLVLVSDLVNRRRVLEMSPVLLDICFPLLQVTSLSSEILRRDLPRTRNGAATLIELSLAARAQRQPRGQNAYDLADPFGRNLAAFRRCADQLEQEFVSLLAPFG